MALKILVLATKISQVVASTQITLPLLMMFGEVIKINFGTLAN